MATNPNSGLLNPDGTYKDGPVVLTQDMVQQMYPKADASVFYPLIQKYATQFGCMTLLRLGHWMGQVNIESAGLTKFKENLNYSSVSRILAVFPSHFNQTTAQQSVNNPVLLGSYAYGGRMGNDPYPSQDGYNFAGKGGIQLSGKQNYISCDRALPDLGVLSNPQILAQPEGAIASAFWFFKSHGCTAFADRDDVTGVTKHVQGGSLALSDRQTSTTNAIQILLGLPPKPAVKVNGNPNNIQTNPTTTPTHSSFRQPTLNTSSEYPNNFVYESRSGHIIVINDTPGNENILIMHRSGTMYHVDPNGTLTEKVMQDRYEIVSQDSYTTVSGDSTNNISGQYYTNAEGDVVIKSGGNMDLEAPERIQMNTPTVNVANDLIVSNIQTDMISMTGGAYGGTIGDLKTQEAVHADTASGISDGNSSGGGSSISATSGGLSISAPNGTSIAGPVSMDSPLALPSYASGSLPTPSSGATAVYNNGGIPLMAISDGTHWYANGSIIS